MMATFWPSGGLVDHQTEDGGPTVFQMKKQSGQLSSDLTFTLSI